MAGRWRFVREKSFDETLWMAFKALERGTLFRKSRGDVAPEFAEAGAEVECETETCHEGEGLLEEEAEEEEVEAKQAEEAEEAAPVAPAAEPIMRPELTQTQRLLALRLVYEPKPAQASELAQLP